MVETQLTRNFALSEFVKSSTAKKRGINNDPSETVIDNLRNLCQQVLQPFRTHFDVPITITSGYRSALLNSLVGGAKNSQHKFGEAADIFIPKTDFKWYDGERHTDMDIANKWFDWIQRHTDYDQLILETKNHLDFWIHVSCRRDLKLNRHQVIYYMVKAS